MKMLVTSFGIVELEHTMVPSNTLPPDVGHLVHALGGGDRPEEIGLQAGFRRHEVIPGETSLFYRMPPVDMQTVTSEFLPDYAVLVLCEKLVMDRSSFERLEREPPPAYRRVSETLRLLNAEGFVELVDFKEVLSSRAGLLKRMLELDLAAPGQWREPLRAALKTWRRFAAQATAVLPPAAGTPLCQRG